MKEAVALALRQNPDVLLARLDEQKANEAVRVARDPFVPKVYGGSGLAFTSGYPNSIEGAAPSIFQARTDMALFNRPRSYELAAARENARGASIDAGSRSDEVAFRTASVFLDAEQARRTADLVGREVADLESVLDAIRARVQEGREIPLETKKAELNLARARQRAANAVADQNYAEALLAQTLGFPEGDLARPATEERAALDTPADEEGSVQTAIANSREIQRLSSALQAKTLEIRGQQASRLPQFDLVAQYSMFAKHNYQDFFRKFQRNNGQLGVSIRVPLLVGSASTGLSRQYEADAAKLRIEVNRTRSRVAADARKSFQNVHRMETARDVAKLDLDVAREQISVLLAQFEEGRITRQTVDQARLSEQDKWIIYYDAQSGLERAKLDLLRQTGTLQAALRN